MQTTEDFGSRPKTWGEMMKQRFYVFKFMGKNLYVREFRTTIFKSGISGQTLFTTEYPTNAEQLDVNNLPDWLNYLNRTVVAVNVEVEEE